MPVSMHFATCLMYDDARNHRPGQHVRGDCQVWLFALPARDLADAKFADVASCFISFHPRGSIRAIRGYSVVKDPDARLSVRDIHNY